MVEQITRINMRSSIQRPHHKTKGTTQKGVIQVLYQQKQQRPLRREGVRLEV